MDLMVMSRDTFVKDWKRVLVEAEKCLKVK